MSRQEKFQQLVTIKGGAGVLANNVLDRDERIAELEADVARWKHHAINQYARRTGVPIDDAEGRDVIEKLLSSS